MLGRLNSRVGAAYEPRLWSTAGGRWAAVSIGFVVAVALVVVGPNPAQGGVDGDGDADIVFATYAEDPSIFDEACLGDGVGGFICSDFNVNDPTQGMAAGDLDDDGDIDVILANDSTRDRVCLNDGTGHYPTCADLASEEWTSFDAAVGDVDDDGDQDVVVATFGDNKVCINDGSGAFPSCSTMGSGVVWYHSFAVALGDLDSDGHLDAVFSNDDGEPHRICLGDGAGSFSCTNVLAEFGVTFSSVALGLVDGDGDLDAVFSNHEKHRVCIGDGTGGFLPCSDLDVVDRNAEDVALGDLNEDSVLDATLAVRGAEANRTCLGDGSGGFDCADLTAGVGGVRAVDTGDVNSDGHVDVVFADAEGPNPMCLGDGSGGFACSDVSAVEVPTTDLVIVPGLLNSPPACGDAVADPGGLWPPNHRWRSIAIDGVTDPDGDAVSIAIVSIFQDEPVNGRGDGNTIIDGRGVGTAIAEVRAERAGGGNGRVYHIAFTADDGNGASCSGLVTVGVPNSKKAAPVDDGALYDSTVSD